MRKTTGTTAYRESLRLRILDTALALFKRRGIKAVRMDDIATEMEKYGRILEFFRRNKEKQAAHSREFMRKGIEHGFFRGDLNYDIVGKIGDAAMDFVMQTRLYEQYKLDEIFHTFIIVFLRGCCTEKGLAYLDKSL